MRLWTVDAFTTERRPFTGNPAAVCLLDGERPKEWLQSFASEMNLSETAYVRKLASGYSLRWFTPAVEVALCGHATLAAAHVLWSEELEDADRPLEFHTLSGLLTATPRAGRIELDFPATPATEEDASAGLADALGIEPQFVGHSEFDRLLVVSEEEVLRGLEPDFTRLKQFNTRGIIVTSPTRDPAFDFVSRFFAPASGVNEDPVTGSAHCCLAPYWSERLGKQELVGYQASPRGGVVHVRIAADRVILGGEATTVLRAEIDPAAQG